MTALAAVVAGPTLTRKQATRMTCSLSPLLRAPRLVLKVSNTLIAAPISPPWPTSSSLALILGDAAIYGRCPCRPALGSTVGSNTDEDGSLGSTPSDGLFPGPLSPSVASTSA